MAKFVSISGPSITGKTSLVESLKSQNQLSDVVFGPDMHSATWNYLLDNKIFDEYIDVTTDSAYLCTYILRLLNSYNKFIESYEDTDKLVILDSCWLDFSIYSTLNMWYTRLIKQVQEEILEKTGLYDDRISRIYILEADDHRYPVEKFRIRGRVSDFQRNRSLEIQYYNLCKNFKNAVSLPSTDISKNSDFIISDLQNLGYLF